MTAKRYLIRGWRLGLLALLASALSLGFNGNGCNLTDDTNSGSSTILIIKANSHSIVKDHDPNPESELNVPAQAVDNDTEVAFIPFRQKEDLPEPLPAGCEFLGGANLQPKNQDKVNFRSGKEADCYVVLPDNVRAEEFSNTDIKLMEFIDGHWVIVLPDKKGKVHTAGPKAGYIGPDEENPVKLTGIRPFCWAIINDPAIIQSLYNLWLTITTDSTTGSAGPTIPIPPVLILPPITPPVIAPPPTVIVPPAPVTDGPNWILMKPANAPSARLVSAISYDLLRQRTVLFGGSTTGYDKLNDTWEYDGVNWIQMRPANSPSVRGYLAMAYDSVRQKTVLFGGGYYGSVYFNDTWEWDGINWTQLYPKTAPHKRTDHAMVYDSARQRIVLFGGFYEGTSLNDTWEWDGTNWTLRNPVTSPQGRHYHSMVYDSARQKTVLFGGENSTTTHICNNETWEWDGINWTLKSSVNKPTARAVHAMAYDTLRQKTILFGGDSNNDTWEWDGATWTQITPANNPSSRSGHMMAYDPARQRTVLFGGRIASGISSNETWEYGNIAYYPPNTQVPFQIVLSPTVTGWEIDGVGKPCILKENGIYKMWYRGNNYWWAGSYYQNDGSIGYTESTDGVNWANRQRVHLNGTVLTDYRLATDPWVMKEGGTYRMWQADYYAWIGGDWSYYITHLTSADGINWANEKTVLTGSGNLSNYDDYCTSQPSLVKEANGAYSMWYGVNQRPRVGVGGPSNIARASSIDGITWTGKQLALARIPGTPEENVLTPDVIKEPDGTYTMYYTAASGPDSVIYRATSTDGINWADRRQILTKTRLRSDILGVSSPHYFKDTDGTEYLYFSLSLPVTEKAGYKEYIGRVRLNAPR